jgi:hypothetical protein
LKNYVALALIGLAFLVPAAKADLVFNLNQSGCCGNNTTFATVVLQQINGTTVQVTVTVAPNVFAGTPPPAPALAFNVSQSFSYVPGTMTAGFTPGGQLTSPPFGTFGSIVDCTDPTVCGNGTSPPTFQGPLTFQITNAGGLLLSDFVANAGGFFFAADLGVVKTGGGFNTGSVGTNTPGTPSTVPEPGSFLLLVSAAGMGLWLSRKRLTV